MHPIVSMCDCRLLYLLYLIIHTIFTDTTRLNEAHSHHKAVREATLLHALRLWAEAPPERWAVDGCGEAGGAARLERGEAPPYVDDRPAGALDREERGREQRHARDVDSAQVAQLLRAKARAGAS